MKELAQRDPAEQFPCFGQPLYHEPLSSPSKNTNLDQDLGKNLLSVSSENPVCMREESTSSSHDETLTNEKELDSNSDVNELIYAEKQQNRTKLDGITNFSQQNEKCKTEDANESTYLRNEQCNLAKEHDTAGKAIDEKADCDRYSLVYLLGRSTSPESSENRLDDTGLSSSGSIMENKLPEENKDDEKRTISPSMACHLPDEHDGTFYNESSDSESRNTRGDINTALYSNTKSPSPSVVSLSSNVERNGDNKNRDVCRRNQPSCSNFSRPKLQNSLLSVPNVISDSTEDVCRIKRVSPHYSGDDCGPVLTVYEGAGNVIMGEEDYRRISTDTQSIPTHLNIETSVNNGASNIPQHRDQIEPHIGSKFEFCFTSDAESSDEQTLANNSTPNSPEQNLFTISENGYNDESPKGAENDAKVRDFSNVTGDLPYIEIQEKKERPSSIGYPSTLRSKTSPRTPLAAFPPRISSLSRETNVHNKTSTGSPCNSTETPVVRLNRHSYRPGSSVRDLSLENRTREVIISWTLMRLMLIIFSPINIPPRQRQLCPIFVDYSIKLQYIAKAKIRLSSQSQ